MKRFLALFFLAMLVPALWLARGAEIPGTGPQQANEGVVTTRFVPVDVYVDAGTKHLGAYQVEIAATSAQIVGLEGGTPKAYQSAPHYDPAAIQGNRVIVAAFSTDQQLPTGDVRVARLHLMATGNADPAKNLPDMTSKLVVATDGDGKKIEAKLTLRPYQGEKQ
jgi:hypothetical protein